MHHSRPRPPIRELFPLPGVPRCHPVTHADGAPPPSTSAQTGAATGVRWGRRRVRSGATAAGARALRPARVVVLRRPGGRRTGRATGSPSGPAAGRERPAPGRPARFHAAVHGAQRALAVMLARKDRSCHGRAASGGPVVTGLSSTSTSLEEADHPLPEPLRRPGRTSRIRRDQPADPGVRAAARLQRGPVEAEVLGVVLGADHPPGHRPGRGAVRDRRVLPDDGVPGRREQRR